MVAKLRNTLGNGLFTVAEAALYARVSPQMMARWLFGNRKGQSVLHPQFRAESRFVSFLDLVQTLAIREIRIQRKVPLPKFRQAIRGPETNSTSTIRSRDGIARSCPETSWSSGRREMILSKRPASIAGNGRLASSKCT